MTTIRKRLFLFIATFFLSLGIAGQPVINSFLPVSGPVGTNVTINGNNFSTTPGDNIVFFGAVRASVSASTATSLTVSVPSGATYQLISVTVNGLTAYTRKPFTLTFAGGDITSSSFADKVDFTTDLHPNGIVIADLDGDGRSDLATPNNYSITGQPASISILKNTSPTGTIAFAPKLDINNGVLTYALASGDINGDGKPDLIACSIFDQNISVFRNTSSSGTISFAPKVDFVSASTPFSIGVRDLDGDGKPDIAVVNALANSVSIFRNTSSASVISFAPKVDFSVGLNPQDLAIGDFDGDGKHDIVVTNKLSFSFSALRNTSTAGTVAFAPVVDIPVGAGNEPHGITIADIDGDDKLDACVVIHTSGSASAAQIFRNTSTAGNIALAFATSVSGGFDLAYHISAGDINGDGKPDLALSVTGLNKTRLFQNYSTPGVFNLPVTGELASFSPYAIEIADLDDDSRPELITSFFTSDKISIFKNRIGFPVINSFTPVSAPLGATVTITGINFTGATSVTFGGTPAASFTVVNSTTITAVVGTGTSGDVVVTTPIGSADKPGFTFEAPPVISSFVPTNAGAGVTVTITGTNLTGTTAVSFGGVAASSFTVVNSTTIEAVVGSGASGVVSVSNAYGTATLPGFVFVEVPVVFSFTPTSGGAGTIVNITGTHFSGATAVSFGGIPAASFTVNSSTSITATVGIGGTGSVSVTTIGGTGSLVGFIFSPPVLVSFTPESGHVGSTVTINGTGFGSTPAGNIVYFGAVKANIITASSTTLTVAVPAGATYSPITVTINNLTAHSSKPFVPSFPGGAPLIENSFVKVFDSVLFSGGFRMVPADYDGDAKVDAGVVSGPFYVYRNLTAGNSISFAPKQSFAGPACISGTSGDVDGDGKLDFVSANYSTNNISILRNTSSPGTIAFAPEINISVGPLKPTDVSIADIDGDGKTDIALISQFEHTLSLFRNISIGNTISFAPRIDFSLGEWFINSPGKITIADLDGDNKPDIVTTDQREAKVFIFRNTSTIGAISLAPRIDMATNGIASGIGLGDLNADGKPEIAIIIRLQSVAAIFGNSSTTGNISFAAPINFTTDNDPESICISDLDGDGKPDVNTTGYNTFGDAISILKNTSTGSTISFDAKKTYSSIGKMDIAAADMDMDGRTDIVTGAFVNYAFSFVKNQVGGPNITSFTPTTGAVGTVVAISGGDFTGATSVSFGGVPVASYTVVNATTITAVIGTTSASGNVVVTTPNGVAIRAGWVFIAPPKITSFTPASGGTNAFIAITGTNLSGATSVSFGGVPAASFGVASSTSISASVGAGASGQVKVITPGGSDSLTGFIYYPPPTITSFTPTSGTTGTVVTISGTYFTGATIVSFGGIPATSFTVVNDNTITAIVGSGGTENVIVTTPGGTVHKSGWTFIPPAPVITSFTPTSATAGTSVTITGTNFIGATAVSFGGTPASSFVVSSSTSITAIVGNGASGNVSVTTAGGTGSLAGFVFNFPTGINDPVNNSRDLVVYPNPSDDLLIMKHPASVKNARIRLLDMTGREIRLITTARNSNQTEMSVRELSAGVYQVIWTDGVVSLGRTLMVR